MRKVCWRQMEERVWEKEGKERRKGRKMKSKNLQARLVNLGAHGRFNVAVFRQDLLFLMIKRSLYINYPTLGMTHGGRILPFFKVLIPQILTSSFLKSIQNQFHKIPHDSGRGSLTYNGNLVRDWVSKTKYKGQWSPSSTFSNLIVVIIIKSHCSAFLSSKIF